jgi:hypothetical protein
MIVSGRDSGIEMVAFELMIGMTVMAQTRCQCVSGSGINEKNRKQDSDDSSHGIKRVLISGASFFKR